MEAGQTQSAGWGQKYPSYRGQEYLTQSIDPYTYSDPA